MKDLGFRPSFGLSRIESALFCSWAMATSRAARARLPWREQLPRPTGYRLVTLPTSRLSDQLRPNLRILPRMAGSLPQGVKDAIRCDKMRYDAIDSGLPVAASGIWAETACASEVPGNRTHRSETRSCACLGCESQIMHSNHAFDSFYKSLGAARAALGAEGLQALQVQVESEAMLRR